MTLTLTLPSRLQDVASPTLVLVFGITEPRVLSWAPSTALRSAPISV